VKKSEIFCRLPLANVPENSIIGAVPERRGRDEETKAENEGKTKACKTFGKIEGIGDVLSDGPRKFLGSQ
jgi:hypothetical protein